MCSIILGGWYYGLLTNIYDNNVLYLYTIPTMYTENKNNTRARGKGATSSKGATSNKATSGEGATSSKGATSNKATRGKGATNSKKKKITRVPTIKRQLNDRKKRVEEALREMRVLKDAFAPLVDSCSQLILMRDRLFDELLKEGFVEVEISREGESRKRANPYFKMYAEVSKELRQALDALTMTVKSSSLTSEDDLDILDNIVKNLTD